MLYNHSLDLKNAVPDYNLEKKFDLAVGMWVNKHFSQYTG